MNAPLIGLLPAAGLAFGLTAATVTGQSGTDTVDGASARRFRDIVKTAGADALISNHTAYDGSKMKLPAMARRKPGDPHPYVVGNDSVQRYLTVADECAKAGLLRLP